METRKASCPSQNRATLAKRLHGLCKSSGVISCIANLPIDSLPMVSYSNFVCKIRRFRYTRLLKLPCPRNPGQGSLKVIESDTIDSLHMVSYYRPIVTLRLKCTAFAQYRGCDRQTDGQTDRQTDRRTRGCGKDRASIASRG